MACKECAKEIARLKKAVNVARQRAREAEAKSANIIERCQPIVLELGKWRTAFGFLEKHCDDEGKKFLSLMFEWYNRYLFGPIEEEVEGHPPSGMCVKCPYHS